MQTSSLPQITDRSTSLLVLTCASLALTLLVLAGCTSESQPEPDTAAAARPVRVTQAEQAAPAIDIRIPGVLRARQRATLAFLNDGYLDERRVRLGDKIDAGATLATLYNPSLQPGLAAAQADVRAAATRLEQLEVDTRRQASLVERDLVSDDALDQTRTRRDAARAALEQTEARLDQARAQLDDAALRAPFAGRIVDFMAEPGDFARAGQPIMAIADDSALEVRAHLPQSRTRMIAVGETVGIRLQDSGRMLSGRVREVGLAAPGSPVPVVVEPIAVEPDNNDAAALYPGQPVHLAFSLAASDKVRIPLNAVIDPGTGAARVFIARRSRRTGRR
ncbi:MAG: efflux RND transporter periplasmic adaptor subunit [Wenzhouxiangellaceae bacterium]